MYGLTNNVESSVSPARHSSIACRGITTARERTYEIRAVVLVHKSARRPRQIGTVRIQRVR
jgi:hypothetical protein